ncbi:MAG: hypothetical protein K6U87_14395 [Firmicutes bacterium]|nr:hypothetical protein [Bacillota bacterium]
MTAVQTLVLEALEALGGSAYEGEIVDFVAGQLPVLDEETPAVARAVHAALAALARDGRVRRKPAALGWLWLAAWQPE